MVSNTIEEIHVGSSPISPTCKRIRLAHCVSLFYGLIKFKNSDVELSVNVFPSEDTVWLTIEQMAILFDRDGSVISRHISNIYNEGELDKKSTCAFFAHK